MTKLTDLEIKKRLFAHKVYILSNGKHGIKLNMEKCDLSGSDLSDSNLSYSNLSYSNLRDSDLSYSYLSGSNLRDSDLSYSYLSGSDLRGSDLSYSNLRGSNLSYSNLSGSNLSGSNLSGSNLDYSCWGLSCKTLNVKIDKKIAVQLLYHTMRAMQSVDDKECKEFLRNKSNMKLVNQFHRVEECGEIT